MIAIINYGLGNLTSILNMHRRLGIDAIITNKEEEIRTAHKLILPGVGHFKTGMQNLQESGLQQLLNDQVLQKEKPVLGICLGAQLMTRHSDEGNIIGLGWVDADTIAFNKQQMNGLKVPHMGWADISIKDNSALWNGFTNQPRFYHVHAYHFKFDTDDEISATANYGYSFATAFQKKNIYGTQFHPEKSNRFGMQLIQNFAAL